MGTEPYLLNVAAEVERFFDESSRVPSPPPKLVLLLGPVASGKSYTRRRHYRSGYVIVDAAEIFVSLSRGGYYDFPGAFLAPLETIGALVALRAVSERRSMEMARGGRGAGGCAAAILTGPPTRRRRVGPSPYPRTRPIPGSSSTGTCPPGRA